MRVHLIDGTYELFRAFFGTRALRKKPGSENKTTQAFLRSLWNFLRKEEITYAACAFDHVIESFRNDLFSGYKTGEGLDPELLSQFPLAEAAAYALGLEVWPMVEFEADDALGSAATRYDADPTVTQVLICSPDKDLSQCVVGTRVVCFDRFRQRTLDHAGVVAMFGVEPRSIPDWLALVGDTADGIPGVPRWGEKSASAVLARYGHLEAIPRNAKEWAVTVRGASLLAESLSEHREQALLYRKLATLRSDAPVTPNVQDLRWSGARREALTRLCQELDDASFLERVDRFRPISEDSGRPS